MNTKPLLEATAITKNYPKKSSPALTNINLTFMPGELVAVIGHNGAGKSTLFDILGGLIKPTSGTLTSHIDSSAIGWCPQREIIDWSLTVHQNILLGLDLRAGKFHARNATTEIAEIFGLNNYIHRTAETLSGGELRRTQIARAVIGEPKLMILDEPTTGLDPDGINTVFSYLQTKVAQGATALVSTHETSKFSEYCTRVVALNQGQLIADMPAAEFMAAHTQSNDLWEAYQTLVSNNPKGAA